MYAATEINPLYATIIFLLTTSFGQTLFAAILLLFTRQGDKIANRILSLFMIGLSLCLSIFFLVDFWQVLFPHTLLVTEPLFFLLPSLIWLYISRLTKAEGSIKLSTVVYHVLATLFVILLLIPFYQLSGVEKLEWYYFRGDDYLSMSSAQQWTDLIITPVHVAAILWGILYVVACYRLLVAHGVRIEHQFSNTEQIRLGWLKYLLVSCGVIYVATALTYLIGFFKDEVIALWIITVCVGCVLLSVFGYFGVNQRHIYDRNTQPIDPINPQEGSIADQDHDAVITAQKYKNSPLSMEHVEALYEELLVFMREQQPFLNADLTIQQLADQTRIAARDLSRIINERGKKNFMEFINEYRIDSVLQRLKNSDDDNVLEMAMAAGFNSKSSFYEAFKRITNTTPMAYKKQLENM